jgi:hypothetical protein
MLNVAFCSIIGIIWVFSAKFTTEVFPDVEGKLGNTPKLPSISAEGALAKELDRRNIHTSQLHKLHPLH